ncbi:MAG TPA: hypothetical protein VGR78_00340 [Verrucomicrobiae bacterium]|nr:hypothetical protein [Verrucomicrobiae bacterium]
MLKRWLESARAMVPALLAIVGLPVFAASGPVWRFSNPRPHGNDILEMGFQDGVVWQVGDRGRLYTSPDLDTWFPHETGTTKSLRSITFFNGKPFISTAEGGILSGSSPDTLSLLNLNTTDWLEGIATSTNAIVAVGDNGAIYSTADGVNWGRRGSFTTWLRNVAYGNGSFVAVGENGFVAMSADGKNWNQQKAITSAHLNKAAFLNNRFWILGEAGVLLTNDARNVFAMVNLGVTNTLFAIAGNTNEVVIAGDSVALLGNLQNGTWTPQADASTPTLAPLWPYYSAVWDGRLFLLGGRSGMQVEGYRTNSTSPIGWYTDTQATRNWLWSAMRAPDFYAAAGAAGTIVTSLDGIDWTQEVVPSGVQSEVLLGIGGNTNLLIAAGSTGTVLRSRNTFTNVVSTNATGQLVTNVATLFGVIWDQVFPKFTTNDLQAVAANAGMFVVAGAKGLIFTSTDGTSWQSRKSGVTNYLSGATAWPSGFVIAGASGVILASADGISWQKHSPGVTNWVYAVRYVGGKLIAVGENGLIMTSTDGTQWQTRPSGTAEWLNDVTCVNNIWYAVGGDGIIVSSPDAITWSANQSGTSRSLYGAVTDGDQLIAAGLEGIIVRSQLVPITSPVNFLDYNNDYGNGLFLFGGVTDQRFTLEGSTDLSSGWTSIANLELLDSSGTLTFDLPNDSPSPKFFRTRLILP